MRLRSSKATRPFRFPAYRPPLAFRPLIACTAALLLFFLLPAFQARAAGLLIADGGLGGRSRSRSTRRRSRSTTASPSRP